MNEKELQIKLGNATEKFIAKTLRNAGYWCYNIPKKVGGQPCDLFAFKEGKSTLVWLIDGKHVSSDKVSFTFDRIEPNQISAFAYARDFAKAKRMGFAIYFERTKKLYWFHFNDYVKYTQLGMKSVNMSDLTEFEEVLKDEDSNK